MDDPQTDPILRPNIIHVTRVVNGQFAKWSLTTTRSILGLIGSDLFQSAYSRSIRPRRYKSDPVRLPVKPDGGDGLSDLERDRNMCGGPDASYTPQPAGLSLAYPR